SSLDRRNSGITKATAFFDNAVLYPNPYMVVTKKGYTKHYYAGNERIAAVIGTGGFEKMESPLDGLGADNDSKIVKSFNKYQDNDDPFHVGDLPYGMNVENINGETDPKLAYHSEPLFIDSVEILYQPDMLGEVVYKNGTNNGKENKVYFYHPDHLGSASWITNKDADIVAEYQYAPYGELIYSQQSGYDERYKFTGKERDGETGYDYFGARFFWSALGHWLSVDPLADKYPGISPYAYCAWNPIKYVDPDGRRVAITGAYMNADKTTSIATFYYGVVEGVRGFYCNGQRLDTDYANKATDAIGKIHDGGKYGKMLVDAVVNDDRTINLTPIAKPEQNASLCELNTLRWSMKDYEAGSELVPSFITLSHEFGHFITDWYKLADYGIWYDKVTNDEKLVVNFENLIRNENHLDLRKYYGFPSTPGGPGEGEIPQWDWVGNYLEILSNGL
ncbi:MAG: RHS repeat-associated core domain-containing protein, partial [Paludibacteraceae bacterium]|nr:RHS repeat-associated core domain-containing protein [Paludibacteraceae bacterium]